jgi:2-amino-4-hydroxy-6-hydroxymethyldihydropteridine diphosphokinase
MSIAYIVIGSNLGDREDNCEKAVHLLKNNDINVLKRSSMINTRPWGVEDQPDFINMAIEVETGLEPDKLLNLLKKIEGELGRGPDIRWGPRVIDLDIIFYNDLVLKTRDLEIPHPGIKDRWFVLKPLSEIAPDKVHPVLKKTIRELLGET